MTTVQPAPQEVQGQGTPPPKPATVDHSTLPAEGRGPLVPGVFEPGDVVYWMGQPSIRWTVVNAEDPERVRLRQDCACQGLAVRKAAELVHASM